MRKRTEAEECSVYCVRASEEEKEIIVFVYVRAGEMKTRDYAFCVLLSFAWILSCGKQSRKRNVFFFMTSDARCTRK